MQAVIISISLGVFLLSPNLLYLFGIDYGTSQGNFIEKIHPTFFLIVLALIYAVAMRIKAERVITGVRNPAILIIAAAAISAVVFSALSGESGGGALSSLLITFSEAGFLALLLRYATASTLVTISHLLGWLFIINSTVGILESSLGFRILPYVAAEVLITNDGRSTALLGHPLANALMTGCWLLLLLMSAFKDGFRISAIAQITLHSVAMLAFGGRTSLVTSFALFGVYVLILTYRKLFAGKGRAEIERLILSLGLLMILGIAVYQSGQADAILQRFSDGRGSDETRFAAIQMLGAVTSSELWTGTTVYTREFLRRTMSSEYGIELAWIGLVLTYGLPLAIALLSTTFRLLIAVGSAGGLQARISLLFFGIVTFSSTSISGKSLIISNFVVLFLFFYKDSYRIQYSKEMGSSQYIANLPNSHKGGTGY